VHGYNATGSRAVIGTVHNAKIKIVIIINTSNNSFKRNVFSLFSKIGVHRFIFVHFILHISAPCNWLVNRGKLGSETSVTVDQ
jgi:hypothetical protein